MPQNSSRATAHLRRVRFSRQLSLLCLAALTALAGCEKDDGEPLGAIRVAVTWSDGVPAAGALAFLGPDPVTAVTDGEGRATFPDLPPGGYVVGAVAGEASATQEILLEGEPADVDLRLPAPSTSVAPPTVTLLSPDFDTLDLVGGDTVTVRVRATVEGRPVERARVRWTRGSESLRGHFTDEDGVAAYRVVVAPGPQTIDVTATGPHPEPGRLSFSFEAGPTPLLTLTAERTAEGALLTWTPYRARFPSEGYVVERALHLTSDDPDDRQNQFRRIGLVTDPAQVTFLDEDARDYPAPALYYRVVAAASADYAEGGRTNIARYGLPDTRWLDFEPAQLHAHPTDASLVYLLDYRGERVVLYDYDAGAIRATAQLSGWLGRIVVGDAGEGTEVFVPSGSGHVYVLDAGTLERRALINTVYACSSVAAFPEGFLLVVTDGPSRLRTLARAGGAVLDAREAEEVGFAVAAVPGQRVAIAPYGRRPVRTRRFAFATDGTFASAETTPDGHFDERYNGVLPRVTPDGAYWVDAFYGGVYATGPGQALVGRLDWGDDLYEDVVFGSGLAYVAAPPRGLEQTSRVAAFTLPEGRPRASYAARGVVSQLTALSDGRVLTAQVAPEARFGDHGPGVALVVLE